MSAPYISVVTPTHNRVDSVVRLLDGLRDGMFPPDRFEVIVVADGCVDDTVAVLRGATYPFPLRVLEQVPGRGAGIARSTGAAAATGDVLLFVDDDIEPLATMLATHAQRHTACEQMVLVGAPIPVRHERASFGQIAGWAWWEQQFERMSRPGYRFKYDDVFSGVLSMRAALFRDVGGFDAALADCHEDTELGYRLFKAGAHVAFDRAAGGLHHEIREPARLVTRKYAEGRADVELARRHPELWPVLRLSSESLAITSSLGLLQRLAFAAPASGDLLAAVLLKMLGPLERLRMRGTWRMVQGALLYYHYWRGAAAHVGSRTAFEELARTASTHAAETAGRIEREAPELDLAEGIGHAEHTLDQLRPEAVRLRYGQLPVGLVRYTHGTEPLRGAQLRRLIATSLAQPLAAVLTMATAARPEDDARGQAEVPSISVVMATSQGTAETIERSLRSLLAQTTVRWELLVMDDGTRQDITRLVNSHAARDPRVVVTTPDAGPVEARVAAIGRVRSDWVLLLPPDGWLDREALAALAAAVHDDPELDAVYSGWAQVTQDGAVIAQHEADTTGDLFHLLAQRRLFPSHACAIRRALLEQAGASHSSWVADDWQLWQRVARLGARFGAVPRILAYESAPDESQGGDPAEWLARGFSVINEAHAPAPHASHPRHAGGRPPAGARWAQWRHLMEVTGRCLAIGHEPSVLLGQLPDNGVDIGAEEAAEAIFRAVPAAVGAPPMCWEHLWTQVSEPLDRFLARLDTRVGAAGLGAAIRTALLGRLFTAADVSALPPEGRTLGGVHARRLEVTEPITDMHVRADVQRCLGLVCLDGEHVGTVQLPAFDGLVPAAVLRDAIADACAWRLLGRFFERHLYADVAWQEDADGWSAWRSGRNLVHGLAGDASVRLDALHDAVGWTALIDGLWSDRQAPFHSDAADRWLEIDAASPLPWPLSPGPEYEVALSVGGAPLGVFRVAPAGGEAITPRAFRERLTNAAGFELCRVAIREALVGRRWDDGRSLHEKLVAARDATRAAATAAADLHATATPPVRLHSQWRAAAAPHASGGEVWLVMRRSYAAIGTSGSRVAALPSSLRPLAIDTDTAAGVPVLHVTSVAGTAATRGTSRLLYEPQLVFGHTSASASHGEPARRQEAEAPLPPDRASSSRHQFEAMFVRGEDPWRYTSRYETRKYEQTLAMLPDVPIGRTLELACAEGHFTARLAERVETLVATDVTATAVERTATRCRALANVDVRQLDLVHDALQGPYDLIVCSEVLYYIGGVDDLDAVAARIAAALTPGGHFLTAHAHVLADDPDRTGFDWDVPFGARTIVETFARAPGLLLVRELRTPLYRIALFKAAEAVDAAPEVRVSDDFEMPLPAVAATLAWGGRRAGQRHAAEAAKREPRLPVLMYHRIAPEGPAGRRQYRVTPDEFEAQLRYLRDCGFTAVTLERWRQYTAHEGTLPDRPIVLTFDDGFADFAEHAWPRLRHYGFGALVSLVSGSVGRCNSWDLGGEAEPLLDWSSVRRLAEEGVTFGAHSVTHRRLTALDPAEQAGEMLGSRAHIQRELGRIVDVFAYPYGEEDAVTRHLAGAAGFVFGLSARSAAARRHESLLHLPRIEVSGNDDLPSFIGRLPT